MGNTQGGSSWPAAVAGSAASGMFSGFMQLMQRKTDKQNQIRQNQMNRQMSELEFQQNLDMWNRANEYNSPAQQMARLKAAGLNPNLVYGGSPGNMAVGTLPRYNAPQMDVREPDPINVMQMLSAYQDTQMKQAQIDNLKVNRRIMESEAILRDYRANLAELQFGPARLKNAEANARLSWLFGESNQWQDRNTNPAVWQNIDAEYKAKAAMLAKTNADIALANARRDILDLNKKYMEWGSPAWNAALQAIGLVTRTGFGLAGKRF